MSAKDTAYKSTPSLRRQCRTPPHSKQLGRIEQHPVYSLQATESTTAKVVTIMAAPTRRCRAREKHRSA